MAEKPAARGSWDPNKIQKRPGRLQPALQNLCLFLNASISQPPLGWESLITFLHPSHEFSSFTTLFIRTIIHCTFSPLGIWIGTLFSECRIFITPPTRAGGPPTLVAHHPILTAQVPGNRYTMSRQKFATILLPSKIRSMKPEAFVSPLPSLPRLRNILNFEECVRFEDTISQTIGSIDGLPVDLRQLVPPSAVGILLRYNQHCFDSCEDLFDSLYDISRPKSNFLRTPNRFSLEEHIWKFLSRTSVQRFSPVTLRLSPECKPQQAVLYHLGRDPLILVGLSELRGHGLVLGDTPTITPLNIPVGDDDNDLGDDDYGGEAIVGRLVLAGPLGALDSDGQPDLAALALAAPRIATLATPPSGVSESPPVWIAPAPDQPHSGKAAPTLPVVRRDVLTDPEAQQVTDLLGEYAHLFGGLTSSPAVMEPFRVQLLPGASPCRVIYTPWGLCEYADRAADAWLGAERQEKSVLDMTLIRIVTRTQPCPGSGARPRVAKGPPVHCQQARSSCLSSPHADLFDISHPGYTPDPGAPQTQAPGEPRGPGGPSDGVGVIFYRRGVRVVSIGPVHMC
ncbi:hypothetical protein PAPYR_12863 [Paratrimastix pyriformis]|uniref:Uncharacterized protein n=1 Tax=Paratrimastix pyriformis TaxID=342808 RepID=A0ABQ8U165_9EUKA|nr:hypothetical protein PAPYR_12863 [Paratrimastix pyriformis]